MHLHGVQTVWKLRNDIKMYVGTYDNLHLFYISPPKVGNQQKERLCEITYL